MSNEEIKNLCFQLMKADSEDDVIKLLKDYGFWDIPSYWRLYGDTGDNYSAAGNQANEAEAALVEKITNSRDARLMRQCLLQDIGPKSANAPQSLKEAIGKFFDVSPNTDVQGEISELDNSKRTNLAKGMTLALTGESPGTAKKDVYPCITISDDGEGQTPDDIPDTILSLNRSIKSEIKFAHGRFNMGGTAVFTFCGEKNLQLVISRRHPQLVNKLIKNPIDRDYQWGFTVVKREFPEGNRTKSWYKYLAPIPNPEDKTKPNLLSFDSQNMPIFPEKNEPYYRTSEWGTLIKLYNYQTKARGHALRDSGLLRALDVLLPEIGLPLRIHECRKSFKGHAGSFDNNLNGLQIRLSDSNVDLEFKNPLTENIIIDGQKFEMVIYVMKSKDATAVYRKSDKGLIFTLNGQAQGWFHERFFERAKMGYLKDSLIVIVDCSKVDYTTKEQLFQNSRDRLSTKPIRYKLEYEIEDSLTNNAVLRELREKRRREKTAEKLSNSKPLEDVLKSVIKNNQSLSNLFLLGNRAISSFKSKSVSETEKEFEGKRFPTFFKFKKIEIGKSIEKPCHINLRSRIIYETDVINDFFKRDNSPGDFKLYMVENGQEKLYDNYKINLSNGIATLNLQLPPNSTVGQKIRFISKLFDINHIYNPFINEFSIFVLQELIDNGLKPSKPRTKFPNNDDGKDATNNSGISLPENIREVAKEPKENQTSWNDVTPKFDENAAIAITNNGLSDSDYNANGYDWYVNVDNKYLLQEMKAKPEESDIIKAQFIYGLIIIGISMMFVESTSSKDESEEEKSSNDKLNFEEKLFQYSKSIAPVIVPIINELSKMRDTQEVSL
jgi:hypothetical protein